MHMKDQSEGFPFPEAVPQPVQPEIDRARHEIPAPVVDGALRHIEEIERQLDEERTDKKGLTIH